MMGAVRSYRHTQVGWVIIGVTLALAAVFALTNRALMAAGPGLYVVALFPALLLLFGTLTVTVEDGELRARFGIGLVGKTIPLSEVVSFGVVRNPWPLGWGIRFFPGGTLYNVSGLHAVELRLADGRAYRIGSDQPHALESALRALLRESRPLVHAEAARGGTGTILRRVAGGALVVGLLGLIAFVVALTILEPRPPEVVVTADTLRVRSFAYKAEVPLRDVAAVSLEPCLPRGLRRTNGFAATGVLRGHFEAQGLGSGMLFVDVGNPPFVVVRTASRFLIIGYDDPQRTRALESELRAAWTQAR